MFCILNNKKIYCIYDLIFVSDKIVIMCFFENVYSNIWYFVNIFNFI